MASYQLRPYQQEAVDAVIQYVRRRDDSVGIEAATGAGKSLIIAEIARVLHEISGGKSVLCTAPSAELVTQNREKYLATGNPASVYSASAGSKCLRHPVVFATPMSFKNVAARMGNRFCAIIIDEAHGITPTLQSIIEDLKSGNQHLRVIWLSATPYRLGSGYIYRHDETGLTHSDATARDPYFHTRVYSIGAHKLLADGYLTPPVIAERGVDGYETLFMELNARGQFNSSDVTKAFIGHGRKTAAIVADVLSRTPDRNSFMFFAATVRHAEEIMASLHPDNSAIVTGKTPKTERDSIIARFKAGRIRHLVNVSVLTTGFDAPNVDVVVLMRATESVGLLQQMVGRGLRLYEGKKDVLVFDYAENLERHCPDGDIFNPQIKAQKAPGQSGEIKARCPSCSAVNLFSARPMEGDFEVDEWGYFTLMGRQVPAPSGDGPMPAHYGRRCFGSVANGREYSRCEYRWTSKECEQCHADNDIAARYCRECKAEIIDPNDKLIMDFKALKKDVTRPQTDEVLEMDVLNGISTSGNPTVRVNFVTLYRSFSVWFSPESDKAYPRMLYKRFCDATDGGTVAPQTVTYKKDEGSSFYDVMGYNLPEDEVGSVA